MTPDAPETQAIYPSLLRSLAPIADDLGKASRFLHGHGPLLAPIERLDPENRAALIAACGPRDEDVSTSLKDLLDQPLQYDKSYQLALAVPIPALREVGMLERTVKSYGMLDIASRNFEMALNSLGIQVPIYGPADLADIRSRIAEHGVKMGFIDGDWFVGQGEPLIGAPAQAKPGFASNPPSLQEFVGFLRQGIAAPMRAVLQDGLHAIGSTRDLDAWAGELAAAGDRSYHALTLEDGRLSLPAAAEQAENQVDEAGQMPPASPRRGQGR